jgi:hypothetical protein
MEIRQIQDITFLPGRLHPWSAMPHESRFTQSSGVEIAACGVPYDQMFQVTVAVI